jgi:hypothetical protein
VGSGGGPHPDLTVLAPVGALDPQLPAALVRAGAPHLHLGIRELTGIAGPLVIPGRSSCLRCHDLYRTERDPAWPRVAAQLATRGRSEAPAVDVVLATALAAHAALQVLAFLDGTPPETVDGTLEITVPEGTLRRRSWRPHPECECQQDPIALRSAVPMADSTGTMDG